MRIRRYNDGNVFSALIDKIKAAWAKWKGTLSKLSWGRKIAYAIGTAIKWLAVLAQGGQYRDRYQSIDAIKDVQAAAR